MRQLMAMDDAILKTLQYFMQFTYAPTATEVYTFLSIKTSKIAFYTHLEKLLKNKKAVKYTRTIAVSQTKMGSNLFDLSPDVYTVGEYSIRVKSPSFAQMLRKGKQKLKVKSLGKKVENSVRKIQNVQRYFSILKLFPEIQLVGISGSVAMLNADDAADVDLFIITSKNRLWTGRFIAWSVAAIMGIQRGRLEKKAQNKVCLNLFFDEQSLELPRNKRGEYGAHEVLQMKPVVVKNNCYRKLLDANEWVFELFPNAKKEVYKRTKTIVQTQSNSNHVIGDFIEGVLRTLQLYFINRHRTTELITDTQLWFHPDDYSKKIK